MDYKRKITEVEIEGLGKVRLKSLSAGFFHRVAGINAGPESEREKNVLISAEAVADSLVDENGRPKLKNADEALNDMEMEFFNAIAAKIIETFAPKQTAQDDAIKNSESVPTLPLPSISPES